MTTLSLVFLALGAGQTLTTEQLLADVSQLCGALETRHPGLYRHITRDEWEAAKAALTRDLTGPMTGAEFYRRVAPALAEIRCGHTELEPPPEMEEELESKAVCLPLRLCRWDARWWVAEDLSEDPLIPQGAELLQLDGHQLTDLESKLLACMQADGFNQTGPRYWLERSFPWEYALHQRSDGGPFRVVVRLPGETDTKALELAPVRWIEPDDEDDEEPYGLDLHPDLSVAVLDVRWFGARGFRSFLRKTFHQLATDGYSTLVLDLRGNGGGTDSHGSTLCQFLIDHPFKYFERIEVTEAYDEDDDEEVLLDAEGRRVVTGEQGLEVQEPSPHAFTGRLFVLVDGGTFSTAADVASVVQSNRPATFIGEETGGGRAGNTSGDSADVTLVHSRMTLEVPLWSYTTAGVEEDLGRGVRVDEPLEIALEDRIRGDGPFLRQVRALLAPLK